MLKPVFMIFFQILICRDHRKFVVLSENYKVAVLTFTELKKCFLYSENNTHNSWFHNNGNLGSCFFPLQISKFLTVFQNFLLWAQFSTSLFLAECWTQDSRTYYFIFWTVKFNAFRHPKALQWLVSVSQINSWVV